MDSTQHSFENAKDEPLPTKKEQSKVISLKYRRPFPFNLLYTEWEERMDGQFLKRQRKLTERLRNKRGDFKPEIL